MTTYLMAVRDRFDCIGLNHLNVLKIPSVKEELIMIVVVEFESAFKLHHNVGTITTLLRSGCGGSLAVLTLYLKNEKKYQVL